MKEIFSEKEYCYGQISEARKIFGNKETTKAQYDAMEDALGLGILYAPDEDVALAFQATLHEATMRKFYFITGVWR